MPASTSRSLSRRGILGAAAWPVFAQEGAAPVSAWPRFGRKIRVGMVGLEGHPGEVYGVVEKHPDLELTAIAKDEMPVAGLTRREAFRSTRVYDNFETMFEREQFDVVGVCNTNGHRAQAIVAAAGRGWHVAAEKPVALNSEELRAVRNAIAKTGVGFTSLLPMRYESQLYTMAQLVHAGTIGDVLLMNAQKSYKLGSRADWYNNPALFGSTMQWIGVHMMDLMHWVSGQPFRTAYSYEKSVEQPAGSTMQNVAGAVFQLKNNGVATLNMDYLRPNAAATHGDDRLRVAGTKGILEYRLRDGLLSLDSTHTDLRKPELQSPPFPLFLEFLLHVYQQRPMLIQPEEIYHVVEALNAARTSSETGCAVAVSTVEGA
ncbi:MAG: Gfo/Idh/MocA family oxidoreductase [Bryobacterales bacterium]|nr:Gfo/Idh/MocA family oxidoreductase [Bryobacterales bacterium]